MKKILIIGKKGMLAHNLREFFKRKNTYEVHNLSREVSENDDDYQGNILDYSLIEKLIFSHDIVINTSGVSPVESFINQNSSHQLEVQGNLNLLKAASKKNKSTILVSFGSILDPNKDTAYGQQKYESEKNYKLFTKKHSQIIALHIKLATLLAYDPSQRNTINILIRKALKKEFLEVYGHGMYLRNYIQIDEVLERVFNFLNEEKQTSQFLTLAGPVTLHFSNLVKMIIEQVGQGKMVFSPWPQRYGQYNPPTMDMIKDVITPKEIKYLENGIQKIIRSIEMEKQNL